MRNDAHTQLCSYARQGELREARRPIKLDEASDSQLERECEDRGITVGDSGCDCDDRDEPESGVETATLDTAAHYFSRGDVAEALVYLERALPYPQFSGLADKVARFYRSPT